MKVHLVYGQGELPVELPKAQTTVIEPSHLAGLPDERAAVRNALAHPIGASPLREWASGGGRGCIVFTHITRAPPNDRLISRLLREIGHPAPPRVPLPKAPRP